jgi:hypothetical protein
MAYKAYTVPFIPDKARRFGKNSKDPFVLISSLIQGSGLLLLWILGPYAPGTQSKQTAQSLRAVIGIKLRYNMNSEVL